MDKVTRTERGWAGHFICADRCRFRRNTLLECGDVRIVVSTVGLMKHPGEEAFSEVGYQRHFETMAFHAHRVAGRYWDADESREVTFDSPSQIADQDADDLANDMHEAVVVELTSKLEQGATLLLPEY
jgi:hypothetical protein